MVQKMSLTKCFWLLLFASTSWCWTAAAFQDDSVAALLQRRMKSALALPSKNLMVLGSTSDKSEEGEKKDNEFLEKTKVPGGKNGDSWKAFKAGVYGSVDGINKLSSLFGNNDEEDDAIVLGGPSDVLKRVVNGMESGTPGQRLMQELKKDSERRRIPKNSEASSPFFLQDDEIAAYESKKKLAELKLQEIETQERRRRRKEEREEAALKVKETAFKVGDALVSSVETLATVTGPDLVASLPQTVQSAKEGVKSSVDTGKEVSKKVIKEVKDLPATVERTIDETKQNIKKTQEVLDESSTNLKVFLRLEKPKPKPPKLPPPKPKTAAEIGMQVAGNVAKGTVQVTANLAWWAVKGTSVAAWNGVTSAINSQVTDKDSQVNDKDSQVTDKEEETTPVAPKIIENTTSVPASPPAISEQERNDELFAEVEEALRQAQSALEFADQVDPLNLYGNNKKEGEVQK